LRIVEGYVFYPSTTRPGGGARGGRGGVWEVGRVLLAAIDGWRPEKLAGDRGRIFSSNEGEKTGKKG
jgi:hypothetical protein